MLGSLVQKVVNCHHCFVAGMQIDSFCSFKLVLFANQGCYTLCIKLFLPLSHAKLVGADQDNKGFQCNYFSPGRFLVKPIYIWPLIGRPSLFILSQIDLKQAVIFASLGLWEEFYNCH